MIDFFKRVSIFSFQGNKGPKEPKSVSEEEDDEEEHEGFSEFKGEATEENKAKPTKMRKQ